MQGLFWLALIFGLFTVAAGVVWAVARHSQRKADARAAEATASVPKDDTPPRRDRGGYAGEYSRPQPGRAERYADQAEAANQTRFWAKIVTLSLAAIVAIMVFFCSFWIVGTQNVGIVRSFGKPVGVVANGPQWTAPWETVTEMDYSVQVTDFTASACDIQVRLADGQTACPKVQVRWQINTNAADSLFRRFKGSTQGVENGVLIPALQKYANIVFGDYDPVKLLNSKVPVGQKGNPSTSQLAAQVEGLIIGAIGSEVRIDFLSIPNVSYAKNVQDRINAILAQKAQTLQAEQTAEAQAAANRTISASVSHDPGVLISRCEDLMQEMIKNGQAPTINMCSFGGSASNVLVTGR
jgi:regulator of protease activity HflC (stomatin/prohibitin superfamily)